MLLDYRRLDEFGGQFMKKTLLGVVQSVNKGLLSIRGSSRCNSLLKLVK